MGKQAQFKQQRREARASGGGPQPDGDGGRDLTALWVVGFVVVAALAAFAVIQFAGGDGGSDEAASDLGPAFGEIEINGDSLAELADPSDDPAIGASSPVVTGVAMGKDGGELVVGDPQGTPQVLIFLAHWCPHCQVEVPALVEHWADGAPEGVDVIGVATRTDESQPKYPPQEWLEEEGWSFPTLLDDQISSASEAFGVSGTPFYVFIDGEGTVVHRHSGVMELDDLDEQLAELAATG